MNGIASSENVLRNREERKEKVKKIEFDGPLVRHLQTTRAPKIVLNDDTLRMEWNLHKGDTLAFVTSLIMLQKRFMDLKIIEEELAIISTKKETAIVQKDTAIAEKDGAIARIKIEYDFVKRKCDAELEN